MTETCFYFFCGIGGSGMLSLADIIQAKGGQVAGSDRLRDQGLLPDRFAYLERQGITLFPQDGSGIDRADQLLVTSTAVEETVPDIQAARRIGSEQVTRAQLLTRLFNPSKLPIGVAGTSGKSTVTGMVAWILHEAGLDPTVVNGAVMKNFVTPDRMFVSSLAGRGGPFVCEVDESDGSIDLYRPAIAVLNNISLDHRSIEDLHVLFRRFLARADTAVLNLDDPETQTLAPSLDGPKRVTFSLSHPSADLRAVRIAEEPNAVSFTVAADGEMIPVRLQIPGRHNVANALAALACARAAGVALSCGASALGGFTGLRRRIELVGTRNGTSVIDDFAHNPEKIAATLQALHAFPGRLLVFFQPHGYGPLKLMKEALASAFARELGDEDELVISDPAFFGGTVDRAVGSAEIVAKVIAAGRRAEHVADRAACGVRLCAWARPGDRILVMGARDDTLPGFAREVLAGL